MSSGSMMGPEIKRAHAQRLVEDLGISFTDATTLLDNNDWIFAKAKAAGLEAKQKIADAKANEEPLPNGEPPT